MIVYYIHKARRIVEQYEKWLSENNNADEKLRQLLSKRDAKLRNMVYDMIKKRSKPESIIVITEDT